MSPTNEQGIDATRLHVVNEYYGLQHCHDKGFGAFARKAIAAGTVILDEKPLVVLDPSTTISPRMCGEVEDVISTLSYPDQILFDSLSHGGDPFIPEMRRLKTWTNNSFLFGTKDGIFPEASRFNHSCKPNMNYYPVLEDGYMRWRTNQDIKVGEELTVCYNRPIGLWTFSDRLTSCNDYHFVCCCPACMSPGLEINEMYSKTAHLLLSALVNSEEMQPGTGLIRRYLDHPSFAGLKWHRPDIDPCDPEEEPAYWLQLSVLLEGTGWVDGFVADVSHVAAANREAQLRRNGQVTVRNLQKVVHAYRIELDYYTLFYGMSNGKLAAVEKKIAALEAEMRGLQAHG